MCCLDADSVLSLLSVVCLLRMQQPQALKSASMMLLLKSQPEEVFAKHACFCSRAGAGLLFA